MPVRDLLSAAAGASTPTYVEDVFSTYLYTGTGSTQSINNGIDLAGKGGMVWGKCRSTATNSILTDTVRGVNSQLVSNTTGSAFSITDILTSFNSNGFTLGIDSNGVLNAPTYTYASWTFRKQPKFFDVVQYTGTGSATTIAHSLGSVPGMIIVKRINTTGAWAVYHNSLTSATYYLLLNSGAIQVSAVGYWNSTAPTSTVFSIGNTADVNASGGTYIAYVFASNAGGFGLTGTDNAISCGGFSVVSGAASVTLGYEPQYILYKNISGTAGNWSVMDNMRGFNSANYQPALFPNASNAESYGYALANATGFTIYGATDANYIYMAIRRPMKVPTDATTVFKPVAYTGNGTTNNITTNFPVDLFITMAYYGAVNNTFDRLRGESKYIATSQGSAEATDTAQSSFASNTAVILGPDSNGYVNYSPRPYSSYNFSRRPGFFDEVCYTGTGSATTVAHNLGVAPEMMIVKKRNGASQWEIYVQSLGNTSTMYFTNTYPAAIGVVPYWNNTNPTSTVFSVDGSSPVNGSGFTYVAYLFATCAGVSKVGSYTGNGSTQAIACGFTGGARFVLIKRTDSTGDWYAFNSSDGFTSSSSPYNLLNSTAAQTTGNNGCYASTGGFTTNSTANATVNISGASYIFLAIA